MVLFGQRLASVSFFLSRKNAAFITTIWRDRIEQPRVTEMVVGFYRDTQQFDK